MTVTAVVMQAKAAQGQLTLVESLQLDSIKTVSSLLKPGLQPCFLEACAISYPAHCMTVSMVVGSAAALAFCCLTPQIRVFCLSMLALRIHKAAPVPGMAFMWLL